MNNFFKFIVRHTAVIVFLILEALAAVLVFRCNDYHRSAYLSSANVVTGTIFRATSSVGRYFGLAEANEALVRQNLELTHEVEALRAALNALPDTLIADTSALGNRYSYRRARAVGITVSKSRNMITIDEGSDAGLRQDMAVVNSEGVVGLVSAVSSHFALVLPLINTSSHLSVKLKGTNHRGQLLWDGGSYRDAILSDIPEHAVVEIGDTVLTSGASAFFPEGLMVGVVNSLEPDRNGGFYDIGVRLAVDFNALYDVQVIECSDADERVGLEASVPDK